MDVQFWRVRHVRLKMRENKTDEVILARNRERYNKNKESYLKRASEWRKKNVDKCKEYKVKYYKENQHIIQRYRVENKEKLKLKARDWYLRNNFGISLDEYNEILKQQDYGCKVCSRKESKDSRRKVLFVDHNHKTGKIRGILCDSCNFVLGLMEDNVTNIRKLADYLEKTQGQQ